MTVLAATSGRLASVLSTAPMWLSTSPSSLQVEVEERQPRLPRISGPSYGTLPNDACAVSCSERCRRGLPRAIISSGVSKFGGSAADHARRFRLGGEALAPVVPPGDVVRVDERHGRAPRVALWARAANHSSNWVTMCGSTRHPCPGAPSGEGKVPPREAVGLERARVFVGVPQVVAVREVPLAVPVRAVALLAQHRPPGRKAGVERAPAGDHAAGLVGVQAGQQRGARGSAVVGGRVVAREGHPPVAQAREVGHQRGGAPGLAENHCGVRSWSTMITRMFGGRRRLPGPGCLESRHRLCAAPAAACRAATERLPRLRGARDGAAALTIRSASAAPPPGERAAGEQAALEQRAPVDQPLSGLLSSLVAAGLGVGLLWVLL